LLAKDKKQVIKAVKTIKRDYDKYEERLQEFSENFDNNGAEKTSKIVSEILEKKN